MFIKVYNRYTLFSASITYVPVMPKMAAKMAPMSGKMGSGSGSAALFALRVETVGVANSGEG